MISMTRAKKTVRGLAAACLAVCSLASLAACGDEPPQPETQQTAAQSPDLTEGQEKHVRGQILDVLDKADQSKQPADLEGRVNGPAFDIRSSELQIAQATGKLDPRSTIPRGLAQAVIPTTSGWPRSVFSITTTTQDQQSKRLMVMTQENARSNYKLWGVARLFPGVTMPKFAIDTIGSSMGDVKDSGLKMTPEQAVQQYADILTNGEKSKYAKDFAGDHFREELDKLSSTVQEGMERNKGTQSQTFTVATNNIVVMRSADGGDLVVARVDSQWTRQAGEGRESQPASDEERALFGAAKATSTMQVSYVNVVALYVPSAKSSQKVTAVGAERQPVKVAAL